MPPGAISVGRPSRWGNPFTLADARDQGYLGTDEELRRMCAALFEAWLRDPEREWYAGRERAWRIMAEIDTLRGHDLACWCPLDQPCHADVLLRLANRQAA